MTVKQLKPWPKFSFSTNLVFTRESSYAFSAS